MHAGDRLRTGASTRSYRMATTQEQALALRQDLVDYERLDGEISRLRGQAMKEKQMARQVKVNR